jgi:FMN phosphatase YigB (HAD superfamily)
VIHIGDSPAEDVAGARAAGIEAVLLRRGAAGPQAPDGVRVIASLREW